MIVAGASSYEPAEVLSVPGAQRQRDQRARDDVKEDHTGSTVEPAQPGREDRAECLAEHPDDIDKYIAEGKASGEALMVLRVLAARGLEVPEEIRARILSCADTAQLEAWGDRAATAASVEDVFGS